MRTNITASTTQIHTFIQDILKLLITIDINTCINILLSFSIILPKQITENYLNLVNLITKNKKSTTINEKKKNNFIDMTVSEQELTLSQKNIQNHIKSILLESKRKIDDCEYNSYTTTNNNTTTGTGNTIDIKPEGGNRFVPSKRATLALSTSLSKSSNQPSSSSNSSSSSSSSSSSNNTSKTTGSGSLLSLQSKTTSLLNSLKSKAIMKPTSTTIATATTTTSTAAASNVGRSRLAGLDAITLTGPIRASNVVQTDRHSRISSNITSSTTNSSILSNKLVCAICKEKATNPCAGRCGHVCCQECWTKWLKVNSSCPLCRAPADRTSVTRIIIK